MTAKKTVKERPLVNATFISTVSKLSKDQGGRTGINIPAKIRKKIPTGITVEVTIQEIRIGVNLEDQTKI